MLQAAQVLYEFGPYRLDPSQDELLEGKRKVPLTPKAYQTLLALVENHGRTLGKDELLQKVWPDAFVEDAADWRLQAMEQHHLSANRQNAGLDSEPLQNLAGPRSGGEANPVRG